MSHDRNSGKHVQTAITQDWLATGLSKFCVLKKDVSFIAHLFSGQNSFRSGRNTADRWCWRTIGLDPCETFCLSWHTEVEARSYTIIITLSTKQTWLRGEDTERDDIFEQIGVQSEAKKKINEVSVTWKKNACRGEFNCRWCWLTAMKKGKVESETLNDVQITLARGQLYKQMNAK